MARYVDIIDSMQAIAMRSDQITRHIPNGGKMSLKERMKILEEDRNKPFEERIELYACEKAKREWAEAKAKHPTYTYTEWTPDKYYVVIDFIDGRTFYYKRTHGWLYIMKREQASKFSKDKAENLVSYFEKMWVCNGCKYFRIRTEKAI